MIPSKPLIQRLIRNAKIVPDSRKDVKEPAKLAIFAILLLARERSRRRKTAKQSFHIFGNLFLVKVLAVGYVVAARPLSRQTFMTKTR
jgi:hypothetical protein